MNMTAELLMAILARANCCDLDCEECKESLNIDYCAYEKHSDGTEVDSKDFDRMITLLAQTLKKRMDKKIDDLDEDEIEDILNEVSA